MSVNLNKKYYLHSASEYPFKYLKNEAGNILKNIIILEAPLYQHDTKKIEKFWYHKNNGSICIGIMSRLEWPTFLAENSKYDSYQSQIIKPHMVDIINSIDGWLHCEKVPTFPNSILYSESDNTNVSKNINPLISREIDIIFYGGGSLKSTYSEYFKYVKNTDLGNTCLNAIKIKHPSSKVIYVGTNFENVENVIYMKTLPFYEWHNTLKKCKILLVTAIHDASPRIITDALSNGCSILINANIFGGWKYVTPETGEFMTNIDDCVSGYDKIMNKILTDDNFKPHIWYGNNFGREVSAIKLGKFIEELASLKKIKLLI